MMQNTRRHEIDELLQATHSEDPRERNEALRVLCPCHVKFNDRRVWDRALEMVDDEDVKVRGAVLHVLCDGSPRERKDEVVAAVERLQRDPDEKLRRRARKVMAEYRRTGRINVL